MFDIISKENPDLWVYLNLKLALRRVQH
jgi:hypothetical protein